MKILHVGMLSPHVHQVQRILARYGPPTLEQEHVLPGQAHLVEPDLVVVHGLNFWPSEALRWEVPVVGFLWNDRWKTEDGREVVEAALDRCALLVAPPGSVVEGLPNWYPRRTFVDTSVFREAGEERDIPYFAARNHGRDRANLYWTRELEASGLPLRHVTGLLGPEEMAELYQRSRVVFALCGAEWGPSNTAIEAVFCGAIPVLSDVPQIRQHFEEEDGQVVGARFAEQDPGSILAAARAVERLDPFQRAAEVRRNLEYFRTWTTQVQGPSLAQAILSKAPTGRILLASSLDNLQAVLR